MALFSDINPSSTYWTPPKRANGFTRFALSVAGYNPDTGQQNTFGKVQSIINPFYAVAANQVAKKITKNQGLTELNANISADTDNRLAKLQTMMGAGIAAVGVATGNPGMISAGVQGATKGISGIAGAGGMPEPPKGTVDYLKTNVPKLKDGGQFKSGGGLFGWLAKRASNKGADYAREWFTARANAGLGGLKPEDAAAVQGMKDIELTSKDKLGQMFKGSSFEADANNGMIGGAYNPQEDQAYVVRNTSPGAAKSYGVHESTHQFQAKAPNIANTHVQIFESLKRSDKPADPYLSQPNEIHSRLMELRQSAKLKPTDAVNKANANPRTAAGWRALDDLRKVLTDDEIVNLMNTTASNTPSLKFAPEIMAAKDGGQIRTADVKYKSDDHTEDHWIVRKSTGEVEGEMRDGETVFSQKDSDMIDHLVRTKNYKKLGEYVTMARMKHKNPDGSYQLFEGGGKKGKNKPDVAKPVNVDKQLEYARSLRARMDRIDAMYGRAEDDATKIRLEKERMYLRNELARTNSAMLSAPPTAGGGDALITQNAGGGWLYNLPGTMQGGPGPKPKPKPQTQPQTGPLAPILPPKPKDPATYPPLPQAMGPIENPPIIGSDKTRPSKPMVPFDKPAKPQIMPNDGGTLNEVNVTAPKPVWDVPVPEITDVPTGGTPAPRTTDSQIVALMGSLPGKDAGDARFKYSRDASLRKGIDMGDASGYAMDIVGAGIAAIGAGQKLPGYQLNPEIVRMRALMADRADEGLTASQRLAALRSQQNNQQAEVESLRSALAGGGSAAAMLSGLNSVGARSAAAAERTNMLDADIRRQNEDRYMGNLMSQQELNDKLWSRQYNNALQSRNAYTQAMMARLQSAIDRGQYDSSYGKGSPYYDAMLQLGVDVDKLKKQVDAKTTSLGG